MKLNKLLGLTVIALITLSSYGQTQSELETKRVTQTIEHSIPEFDIKFPETEFKVEKTENLDAGNGNILITNWILQGKDENGPFMYFVAHNKFPKKLKDSEEEINLNFLEIAFQAMLTGSAEKLGGTDFEFTNIVYDDFKGMESICKVFNGDGFIKSRVFKINNDLFMISAGGRKIDVEMVDEFLNSFRIK